MGIPSDRIYSIVMGLSAGIAVAAGVLVAPFQTVIPSMGLLPLVEAFCHREWSQIVSVAAGLITLVLRPAGFLGRRAAF